MPPVIHFQYHNDSGTEGRLSVDHHNGGMDILHAAAGDRGMSETITIPTCALAWLAVQANQRIPAFNPVSLADRIRQLSTDPALHQVAAEVARLERLADELVAEAMADDSAVRASPNVVAFPRGR